MKKEVPKNKFFDINKLPGSEGIIFMGISMNRIGNAQSPQKCFDYLKHLASKIESTDGIGMVICYGDYLYFHSEDPAYKLRDRFESLMLSHKNAFMKLLKKDRKWTHKAFSFITFGQLLLDNSDEYYKAYQAVTDLYKKDSIFQKYVDEDCRGSNHGVGEREKRFILEEITMFYLSQKGNFRHGNRFVTDSEKNWILQVYPGGILKSEVYLFKKNPLNFSNSKNQYEDFFYDLEDKILYDYSRVDLNE